MDRAELARLVEEVVSQRLREKAVAAGQALTVPVAVSSRHIHLCEEDWRVLFGGEPLTKVRDLSQPGEFAARETVTLVGPRGVLENVRVLGPLRRATQVEVSRTDAIRLGLKPPVRDSGYLEGSPGLAVVGPKGAVQLSQGGILAWRHIHMTPEDAARFGVGDKELVSVRQGGDRSLILGSVLVRVSPNYRLELHLDTDEANAGLFQNGDLVELVRDQQPRSVEPAVPAAPTSVAAAAAPSPVGAPSGGAPPAVYDRRLLTASDVVDLVKQKATRLEILPRTLVTALAADTARDKGLQIIRR